MKKLMFICALLGACLFAGSALAGGCGGPFMKPLNCSSWSCSSGNGWSSCQCTAFPMTQMSCWLEQDGTILISNPSPGVNGGRCMGYAPAPPAKAVSPAVCNAAIKAYQQNP